MVIKLYFALAAALARKSSLPQHAAALLDGEYQRAYDCVADVSDRGDRQLIEGDADRLLAASDSLLLLDRDEEAESEYRRAQKAYRQDDDQLRVMSCRNAGWQALKRARYFSAHSCFTRMAGDESGTLEQEIEALIGVTIVHHLLGQNSAAAEALNQAADLARDAVDILWRDIVALLTLDCALRTGIRTTTALSDHAFWQSARGVGSFVRSGPDVSFTLDAFSDESEIPRIIEMHVEYLRALQATAQGSSTASLRLSALLGDGAVWPNKSAPTEAKIEAVLAALGGGFDALGERLLETITNRDADGISPRWNIDLLYSKAKVAAQRGQTKVALQMYASYSREALHCLRSEAIKVTNANSRVSENTINADDVAMRLPAKYRRAYRYIVEHIADYNLTAREVASQIHVTERALQIVFKHSLGVSPAALIRQMRLEGIREELQADARNGETVLDTARRWGVNSRSTLIKSYKKHFNESPSETLNG
jgi:AraC-like DNA-binding protein